MKVMKKILALGMALTMALGLGAAASAAEAESGFAALPAGTYTYVDTAPTAGENAGQVQFDYWTDTIHWAMGDESGSEVLGGDELKFFQGVYLSDRPAYDWLASAPRSTDGYAGNVAGNLLITWNEDGDISRMRLDSGLVQMTAVVSREITADTMTISGATRGQPNLLHSCITLLGETNCLHLTDQGNVVLDNLKTCANKDGVGLKADKIGGDTFIAGTVFVDGKIEWMNRYANIQPVTEEETAVLMTNGQDMIIGGMSVGRVGRSLTFSTGADKGGDIIIGQTVSVDYGRGAPLKDPSTGAMTLSTSGSIIAGLGNVIIGTNTERKVTVDTIGDIQGANVTIAPTYNGTPSAIGGTIGNITASGKVEVVAASVGGIGAIQAAEIVKEIGTAEVQSVDAAANTFEILVDGKAAAINAYTIAGNNYVDLRDLASALSGTAKQFEMSWLDNVANTIITLTSNRAYTAVGGELTSKADGVKEAVASDWKIYLNGSMVTFGSYTVDGGSYFKLRDVAKAMNFGVEWDGTRQAVVIDTTKGY